MTPGKPGRKPISDDTVLLSVKVPREDRDRWSALARGLDTDLSAVVRAYLARWERARR